MAPIIILGWLLLSIAGGGAAGDAAAGDAAAGDAAAGGRPSLPAAWPEELVLVGPGAWHRILSSGDLLSRDSGVARVEGDRIVAVSDGRTEVEAGGGVVSVEVRGSTLPASRDFVTVVLPNLTRRGCNAASCHGAATGQGGFKLSLLGSEAHADYLAVTRELGGRRIDRAEPAASLILAKPSRRLPHRGGRVLPEESAAYRVVQEWAERGFPERETDLRVEALEVRGPPADGSAQVLVTALYSDGVRRDVTHLALYSSNDDAVAAVDEEGRVELRRPGETALVVRFAGHVASVRVGTPYPSSSGRPLARLPACTPVDEHVGRALERLRLEPSGDCGDQTFLRRVSLDLTGRLPSPAEIRAFRERPDRRALVEHLLARTEFEDCWSWHLGQLFGVSSKRMGEEGAAAFHRWLRGQVRRPWKETARAVLTASGRGAETGFYRSADDPKLLAEAAGKVFLGTRWECAQCHDHPFERFRQADYYSLAAMFARVRHEEGAIVCADRGEVVFPRTGKPARPAFPGGTPSPGSPAFLGGPSSSGGTPAHSDDRRLALAEWLVAHPQLGRAFANRVWAHLMGRGLVHPPEDFRASNPPSHPELLDELARLETIPELVSAIVLSAAYSRAGPTPENRGDARFYSHFRARPLAAEVLVDAIAQVSGVADTYAGRPSGTRAVELGDLRFPSFTLDVCGRNRPGAEAGLARTLHLLAGEALRPKVAAARGLLILPDEALVEELYLRALGRPPSSEEAARWIRELERGPRAEAAEDLLWALLNSWEFGTCH